MALAELIEQQRQKRRAQLDKILAGSAPQQGQLNFQPVPLPQSKGSTIVGAIIGEGARAAVANIPTASAPVVPPTAQTVPTSFEPLTAAEKAHPTAGSPGARPLSPRGTQPPPSFLQRAGGAAKQAVQNTSLYKAIAALFL